MANGAMRAWDGTQWVTLPAAAPNPGAIAQAINVNFSPTGGVAATNVQAAIAEVDAEKALLAGSASQAFSASTLTATTGNITTVNATTLAAPIGNITTVNSTTGNITNAVVTTVNQRSPNGKANGVINGMFDDWPLGNSISVTSHLQKLANRWNYDFNGTLGTISVSKSPVNPANWPLVGTFSPKNLARIVCSSAPSGNTFQDFSTQIESVTSFAGKTVTISFYAFMLSGTNNILVKTEQYFGGGGSPSSPVFNTSAPISISGTVWQRYSVTFNVAAVTSKTLGSNGDDTFNVIFTLPLNQTFDFLIGGVKVEEGTVATPVEYYQPYDCYAAGERYIVSSYEDGVTPGTITTSGAISFTQHGTNDTFTIQLPTRMRGLPFVKLYNPATGALGSWNNGGTPVNVSVNTNGTRNVTIALSGGTAGNFCTGHYVIEDPFY